MCNSEKCALRLRVLFVHVDFYGNYPLVTLEYPKVGTNEKLASVSPPLNDTLRALIFSHVVWPKLAAGWDSSVR